MNSLDVISYFPLYSKLETPGLIDSKGEVLFDYNLEEVKVFFYRLFRTIPSTLYMDADVGDLEKILEFFKNEGFQTLFSTCTATEDETINLYIINDVKNIIIKLYWFNTSKQTTNLLGDDDDDGINLAMTAHSMDMPGLFDNVPERRGEMSLFFSFIPRADNVDFIKKFQGIRSEAEEKQSNFVHIFEKDSAGRLKLAPYKVKPFELNIEDHYNDGFKKVNENVVQWCGDFTAQNKKLMLFHGEPGTGKTNYIKNLMAQNQKVRKIYIPPYYVSALTEPGFFGFIKNYSNSLLIIEDAEKVLISRAEDSENSAMSVLLNLTDGILSDILNFKIIATFNVNKDSIDTALTRPGRMHLCHEFKKLTRDKTKNLFNKLYNRNPDKDQEMSLAEIFNVEDNGAAKKEERKIGF